METSKIDKFVKQFLEWISQTCNKKCCVIDSEWKGAYSHENPIKFFTSSLESILCVYCDAYVLVTGNIVVAEANNNTKVVAFKISPPFRKCLTEINKTLIDDTEH